MELKQQMEQAAQDTKNPELAALAEQWLAEAAEVEAFTDALAEKEES